MRVRSAIDKDASVAIASASSSGLFGATVMPEFDSATGLLPALQQKMMGRADAK